VQPRDNGTDNSTRFLSELRELRDQAGLAHAELAARSHYPTDLLQAAEAGPGLPDLPVLSAFVRACGGEVSEWEDRWRVLSGTGGPELLPTRPPGESPAAAAGARAGASIAPPDDHDPARIMAVLARASGSKAASNGSGHSDSGIGAAATTGLSDPPTYADAASAEPVYADAAPAEASAGSGGTSSGPVAGVPQQGRAAQPPAPRQVRSGSGAALPVPALIAVALGILVVIVALLVGTLGLRRGAVPLTGRGG
jgi:hypothetical protein